ncbi:MAG: CsbD family protein [Candidatus Methanoperedens sp.]|nr:CsbD family protein [Candidatus Methanoperedens sp.]
MKEAAGKITKNTDLEIEGNEEKIEGKVQEKVGQIKKVFGKPS